MINASFVMSLNSAFILSVFGWRSNRYYLHHLISFKIGITQLDLTNTTLKHMSLQFGLPKVILVNNPTITDVLSFAVSIFHRSQSYNI